MARTLRAAWLGAASTAVLMAGAASAQHLTMAVGAPVTSLDPHYHQLSPNNAVADMIFDKLTQVDAASRLEPGLAESYRPVAENVWEFKLRPGVRFHNGNPLTADDVAFTFERIPTVPNSPSSFAVYTRPFRNVEVVDPLTLRITTDGPYPLMPIDMTNLRILDRETHEGATTERFNSGELAIGTGPWKVVSYRNGDRLELVRNDDYWGPKPAFANVTYRMITNDATRTASLLAGDVDVIDQVPTADLAKLRADSRVTLSERVGLRIVYLWLDHEHTDPSPFVVDNNGQPIAHNPLKDVRVRRALNIGIDRDAIVSRVMEGAAIPSGQFLPTTSFGAMPDYPAPGYDPEAAKKLLAEAGFPQGFRITLHGPNDRYINDARIIQAIGQMWTRIGVRTQVEAQTWSTFVGRAGKGELSAFLIGWGSSGGEASNPLRNLIHTPDRDRGLGASNRGRYSNPEVDALIEKAIRELDDEKREALLRQASKMALDDVAMIPLHIQTNIWASRKGFVHEARADELTRAQDTRPAQ